MTFRGACWSIYPVVLACLANHGLSQGVPVSVFPNSGSSGSQGDTKPHTTSGSVVNSVTSQPIPRVLVQLGEQQNAFTDGDGRFEFDAVPDQGEPVVLTKPGYFQLDTESPPSGNTTWQMIPEAILFGTVRDQTGAPVQDLPIQLKMQEVYNGFEHWPQVQSTSTNVEGEFRFAELRAGRYLLSTGFFIDGLVGAASSLAFLPSTYPPLTGDRAAGAITLKPGDRNEASLNLSPEQVYPVSVRVSGNSGLQVSFEVTTRDGDSIFTPARFNPANGTFQLTLPSGAYHLEARANGREQLIGTREITVGQAPLEGVSIAVAPLITLPLEVEYQTIGAGTHGAQPQGAQIQDAQTQDAQTKPRADFTLENLGAAAMRMFSAQPIMAPGSNQTPSQEAPRFFQNVEPGRYDLRAQVAPPWYLASASCGNLDLTREPLVLSADAGACTVRAVLRDDLASLKWSILADSSLAEDPLAKQLRHVLVEMISLDTLSPAVSTFTAGGLPLEGSFDIPPGRYLVLALERQQEVPYRNAEALQRYLTLGQQVNLDRNGKAEIQLQIVKGDL